MLRGFNIERAKNEGFFFFWFYLGGKKLLAEIKMNVKGSLVIHIYIMLHMYYDNCLLLNAKHYL